MKKNNKRMSLFTKKLVVLRRQHSLFFLIIIAKTFSCLLGNLLEEFFSNAAGEIPRHKSLTTAN